MNESAPPVFLGTWAAWGLLFGLGLSASVGWCLLRFVRWLLPAKPGAVTGGAERLAALLVLLPASGLLLWIFSPSAPPVLPPPRPVALAALSPRTLADHAAASGAAAGAAAGQRALAARSPATRGDAPPPVDPSLRPGTLVLDPVLSRNPSADRAAALRDALEEARLKLAEALVGLGVPPGRVPGPAQIERDYLTKERIQDIYPPPAIQKEWADAGLETNRQWVRVTLAVGPEQLRDLRAEGRSVAGLIGVGAVVAALGALWGFLRLDAWTKGYLTTALAGAAILMAVGFGGAAVWLLRHGALAAP